MPREILPNLRESEAGIEDAIPHSEIEHMERELSLVQSLDISRTPVSAILEEANLTHSSQSLNKFLNSSAPFNNETSCTDVPSSLLQKLFDCRQQFKESKANSNQESEDQIFGNFCITCHTVTALNSRKLDDPELLRALLAAMSRVSCLEPKNAKENDRV